MRGGGGKERGRARLIATSVLQLRKYLTRKLVIVMLPETEGSSTTETGRELRTGIETMSQALALCLTGTETKTRIDTEVEQETKEKAAAAVEKEAAARERER